MKKKTSVKVETPAIESPVNTIAGLSLKARQQEIFNYLKDNLKLNIDVEQYHEDYYQSAGVCFNFTLTLNDPETGESVVIDSERGSFNV